jgi:hypothetical protein
MVKCGVLFEVRTEYHLDGLRLQRPTRHRFSWFSSVFKQMLRWFPNSKLLLHASHEAFPILKSSKLSPVVDAADLFSKLSIKQSICNGNLSWYLLKFNGIYSHFLPGSIYTLPQQHTRLKWRYDGKTFFLQASNLGRLYWTCFKEKRLGHKWGTKFDELTSRN